MKLQYEDPMEKMVVCFAEHKGVKTVDVYPECVRFKCAVCGRECEMSSGIWEFFRSCIPGELVPEERKKKQKMYAKN